MTDENQPCDSPRAVLSALADDDCRAILVATAGEPRTVSELVDACEIPMATAYRKVDRLADLDLLEERIRVKPRGRNSREYLLRAESIHVSIPRSHASTLTLGCTIAARKPTESKFARVSTDGGRLVDDSSMTERQHRLSRIFERVTGTVGFVETQEQMVSSRYFDDERDASVSEYVTAAAKADGLADAITIPEMDTDHE
ncbi:MAG: helix-turn-helix domain-containing protein [Halobacteriota archaeon]